MALAALATATAVFTCAAPLSAPADAEPDAGPDAEPYAGSGPGPGPGRAYDVRACALAAAFACVAPSPLAWGALTVLVGRAGYRGRLPGLWVGFLTDALQLTCGGAPPAADEPPAPRGLCHRAAWAKWHARVLAELWFGGKAGYMYLCAHGIRRAA